MKRTAYVAVIATVVAATILLVLLSRSASQSAGVVPVGDRIEFYKLHVELAKAVLVGFGTALLGILIPTIFAEARFSFERLKDSRTAYSEAKTGVDYLALRVCTLDLKAAAALVQRTHVKKHEAELFPELRVHLKRRGIALTPEQWGDALYDRLFTMRTLLEAHSGDWDSLKMDERLAFVRAVLPRRPRETLVPGPVVSLEPDDAART
jgi:hypothetical protein